MAEPLLLPSEREAGLVEDEVDCVEEDTDVMRLPLTV